MPLEQCFALLVDASPFKRVDQQNEQRTPLYSKLGRHEYPVHKGSRILVGNSGQVNGT